MTLCTNDELHRSQLELKRSIDANTAAQAKTQIELAEFVASCRTWRTTRCDDHHARIELLEDGLSQLRGEINRTIGKTAGAVGAVTFIVSVLSVLIAIRAIGG